VYEAKTNREITNSYTYLYVRDICVSILVEDGGEASSGIKKVEIIGDSNNVYLYKYTNGEKYIRWDLVNLGRFGSYKVIAEDMAGNISEVRFKIREKEISVNEDKYPPVILRITNLDGIEIPPYGEAPPVLLPFSAIRVVAEDDYFGILKIELIKDGEIFRTKEYSSIPKLLNVEEVFYNLEIGRYKVVVYDHSGKRSYFFLLVKEVDMYEVNNREGDVIDSTYTVYQSLVIGDNTSFYPDEEYYGTDRWYGYGSIEYRVSRDTWTISYFISGYCLDSYKRWPTFGVKYGEPYSSDDENHWAYWVKRVIKHANKNRDRFTDQDILDALWYISERSFYCKVYYNDLLKEVGYPVDGPRKNPPVFNVKIAEPKNGDVFVSPADVKIKVDVDIFGATVYFYGGKDRMYLLGMDNEAPYELVLEGLTEGEYKIAVMCEGIVDGEKKFVNSDPVIIKVINVGFLIDAKHVADEKPIHDDEGYLVSTETYRTPLVVKEGEPVRIIVKVSSATEISGGKIYYTTDCSIPTLNSAAVDLFFV